MQEKRDLFIAIDGNALVHRAFHAYPPTLSTTSGLQVNAVYGFCVMLLAMLKQFDPKYVFCSFDTKAPTFRHTKYADYKATRKPVDETLLAQFPLVEQVLDAFNIPVIKKEGFEADDILGTVSKWVEDGKWSGENLEMYLLTGDRDLLQLISKNVNVCMPVGNFSNLVVYDEHKTLEKYGYLPSQVIDYKAMVGDASDNIPGVKGIGEKTAITLLSKYGTLDNIAKNASEISGKVGNLLREGMEQAEFSRDLATIKRDMNLDLSLGQCLLIDFDENELVTIFKNLEFKSLINKIPKSANVLEREKNGSGQFGLFGSSVEKDDYDWEKIDEDATILVLGYVSAEESMSNSSWNFEICVDKSGEIHSRRVDGFTKLRKCETWYYGYEELSTNKEFISSNGIDLQLLAHNLSSGSKGYSLSRIAFDYVAKIIPEKLSEGDLFGFAPIVISIIYEMKQRMSNTRYSDYVQRFINNIKKWSNSEYKYDIEYIIEEVEKPISRILAKMENRGISIDVKYLGELDKELDKLIENETNEIYKEVGHEFNINSPKQLADVLFIELKLPIRGKISTREEVLRSLIDIHPTISHILNFRELMKISGTYVKPLLLNKTGVVHSDFKQMGTTSGRFSSVNPNMQNIPARGEWASKVRKMFIPRDNFVFIGADYSQIEFRIMADISNDSVLVDDFKKDKDIHRATASRILDKKEEEITTAERNIGKTINFAILFGQSAFGLSQLAGIDRETASRYIADYFKTYSGVARYIDEARKEVIKNGYVQSMLGRTRYIAGLSSKNRAVANAALREAINMPIQGGEADIMKLSMIKIDQLIRDKYENDAFILLQIHDELIFEVNEKVAESFSKDVYDIMKNIVILNVPLDVHISKGHNMAELK